MGWFVGQRGNAWASHGRGDPWEFMPLWLWEDRACGSPPPASPLEVRLEAELVIPVKIQG